MITKLLLAVVCCVTIGFAHNSYTGGYSGAPGRQTCAMSCHGGTVGTLVVTGFPPSYQPLQTYRITVKRNGGATIVNFNATTRVGSTSTVAGTFTPVINSVQYTGADGGVYASPHLIDSAVFQWTAPASGTGPVNFYAAGYQGTTSSASGQSSRVTMSATEITTSVEGQVSSPNEFMLRQNYPNPFNPTTNIEHSVPPLAGRDLAQGGQIPADANVRVKVYDLVGKEIATLFNGRMRSGIQQLTFDATGLPSGIYFYQVTTAGVAYTKKMVLAK